MLMLGLAIGPFATQHALAQSSNNTTPAQATATPKNDISAALRSILEKHDVPGMVAAITTIDHTVAIGAAGKRVKTADTPVTIDDKFHIGSCTKSMTGTLVGMLVQDDTLKWSTTLANAFPEFADSMNPGWSTSTLEQLVTNHSGVPTDLGADGLWNKLWTHQGTAMEQRMTLVEGVLKQAPAAKPGTKYIYSNGGFAIAGVIAERAAKKSWEDLMRERLFTPLGMASAGFGAPGKARGESEPFQPDQPWGHTTSGRAMSPGPEGTAGLGGARSLASDNPGAIGPAGIVHCSIEDWAKYIRLHLRGAAMLRDPARAANDSLGLTRDTFTKLHTPFRDREDPQYAMGWVVTNRHWAKGSRDGDTGRVLTHSGSNTMWFCVAWVAPERDFAILVMCNKGGDDAAKACDEAAWTLIQEHTGESKAK